MAFTVTYNGNHATGGSVPVDGTAYASGALVTVLGNTGTPPLTMAGGTFSYWNTAADDSGSAYGGGAQFNITADVTLYAQWYIYGVKPFGQYTECVAPSDYTGPFLGSTAFWAALVASIVAGFFDPGAGVLGLILTGIAYCHWWLYGRLVCLGDNQCMIGLALTVTTQTNQSFGPGKFDTDYGVNILLAPSLLTETINDVATTNAIQGFLIKDQRSTTPPVNPNQAAIETMYENYSNLGFTGEPSTFDDLTGISAQGALSAQEATDLGLAYTAWQPNNFYNYQDQVIDSNGYLQINTSDRGLSGDGLPPPAWNDTFGGLTPDNELTWSCVGKGGVGTMQVEFEGAGVWDLYQSLLVATPVAAAAATVCAIPFFGWIACVILILIALAIVATGALIGLSDTTTPAEADPSIGVIQPGVDILFVMGRWIFDSAHEGWNELHPVLACQKIGEVPNKDDLISGNPWASFQDFSNPAQLQFILNTLCGLATEAGNPTTISNQLKLENQWNLHPSVDACAPKRNIQ